VSLQNFEAEMPKVGRLVSQLYKTQHDRLLNSKVKDNREIDGVMLAPRYVVLSIISNVKFHLINHPRQSSVTI
jgi:hypothetical protein